MKASFKLDRFASISVLPFYQPNAHYDVMAFVYDVYMKELNHF